MAAFNLVSGVSKNSVCKKSGGSVAFLYNYFCTTTYSVPTLKPYLKLTEESGEFLGQELRQSLGQRADKLRPGSEAHLRAGGKVSPVGCGTLLDAVAIGGKFESTASANKHCRTLRGSGRAELGLSWSTLSTA